MADSTDRVAHWIRPNHQNRIPGRWIAWDTESKTSGQGEQRTQTWKQGAAWRWRTGLKGGDYVEFRSFSTPEALWEWVTAYCRPRERTVITCLNLGYDIRISRAMEILPALGWHLDWCNMSSSVSVMTWRSDQGTLVFSDLFSWIPKPLSDIGDMVGLPKWSLPKSDAGQKAWQRYCLRDAEIVYRAVSAITGYLKANDLGNWQPTGAGMSFATWRHRFLEYNVLVHDNKAAIAAERAAMHTGRAEAWQHGKLTGRYWTEADLKQAYTRIAADTAVPTKLKFHTGRISLHQYTELRKRFNVLARVEVRTTVPCVPTYSGSRTLWPCGEFVSWLWDAELDVALAEAKSVRILECYVYTSHPVLSTWAKWVLSIQDEPDEAAPPVVKQWLKHSGRTLIGRLALRTPLWAVWGTNPDRHTGVSWMVDTETGKVNRMMHVGDRTFLEEERREGRDSLPQITGYILSVCRVRLWEAMCAAGFSHIAHVDTDSLIVDDEGLQRLKEHYDDTWDELWQTKAEYTRMTVYGPRNYRGDDTRKVAGVSRRALEVEENVFAGERWASLAGDMAVGRPTGVTMSDHTWHVTRGDPRRGDAPGAGTGTVPLWVDQRSNVSSLVSTGFSPGA